MAKHDRSDILWYPKTINAPTAETLRALRDRSLLGSFYLAGGTGLALRIGHRLSVDLDFFVGELFDEELLIQRVEAMPGFALVERGPHTIHATIQGIKVSYLGYPYPVLFPFESFLNVPVADPRDIACMKITAIASRGTKRDFIDLYVASQQFGLEHLLGCFARKYARTGYNRMHILKSFTFFEDAEKDPMPHMLVAVDWEDVKRFFEQHASKLAA
jgi:hypothetical protein